ncbi:helix-turn-helix domain-containing protein [uncultured Cohaesibacter sp.]|uniref:helix-turn-helix domain-containing protein n=1 Tax=uncultured Cohaesibacter sp. TaxID=1002546 RepID=UPI0029C6C992|nr:helix-turn-helix domain-containing protein [uncultured Cohaesibacter sp.]
MTRVGYGLAAECAHLIVVLAGRVGYRASKSNETKFLDGPRLVWLRDGDCGEIIAEGGTRAAILSFPNVVLAGALSGTPLGDQMRRTLQQQLFLSLESPSKFSTLVEGLEEERRNRKAGSDIAELHYVSLILVEVWRLARSDLKTHGRAPQGLAERFLLMAGQHLREHVKIEDYAKALGVSRDRLGTAVRRSTGQSPQQYLQHLLMKEAAELLASTGMPISQVAFRLGFSDPAYFTRFFIRMSNVSPVQFRKHAKQKQANGDDSYAAWP